MRTGITLTKTRQLKRLAIPSMVSVMLADWLSACGLDPEGWSFHVDRVEPLPGTETAPITVKQDYTPSSHLLATVTAAYLDQGFAAWSVRIGTKVINMGELHAICRAADLLREDLSLSDDDPSCVRLVGLYELMGADGFSVADVTDPLAHELGFGSVRVLVANMRYLASREIFVDARPVVDGEPEAFAWTTAFHQHMNDLAVDRRTQLENQESESPISVEDFVRGLDDDGRLILQALEQLLEGGGGGPSPVVPRRFLQIVDPVLERFVLRATAAKVLYYASAEVSHKFGLLGKTWRIATDRYRRALDYLRALDADRAAEHERLMRPAPQPEGETLTRTEQITRELSDSHSALHELCASVERDTPLIDHAEDEIAELEERLEAARQRLTDLRGAHSEDDGIFRYHRARIEELQAEQAARESLMREAAGDDISSLKRRAAELGYDSNVYLEAVALLLKGEQPN